MNALQAIAIHGAPRSGTSWLGQLFNSHERVAYRYQPFFSHAFRGWVDDASGPAQVGRFLDALHASRDDFLLQAGDARLSRAPLEFGKETATHLVYKEVRFHDLLPVMLEGAPRLRGIGIVRDPRAVLASWFAAPREFNPAWCPAEEWRRAPGKNAGLAENWYGYERWKALAQLFLDLRRRYPDRFMLVRYEALKARPADVLGVLFDFAGLGSSEQALRFIDASTTRDDGDPYGVFRRHDALRAPELPAGIDEAIVRDLGAGPLARFLHEWEVE